ncbi:MAG: hypothetical protein JXN59_14665 [Anaerolineae bacterium]|nr:hypothetical protein [Anaerolineae bacterium]
MTIQADQQRIIQLTSDYSPAFLPQLPLSFGDYLSLLWRIDRSASRPERVEYYRDCAAALARGLGIANRSVVRMVARSPAGEIYENLRKMPYQGTGRLVDAADRRDAITQLVDLRHHILEMGAYRDQWTLGWPGSRLADEELRERVFAVLFTAFDGQFSHFSRLLLVIDIVLQELILQERYQNDISLVRLVHDYGYPDPDSDAVRMIFE